MVAMVVGTVVAGAVVAGVVAGVVAVVVARVVAGRVVAGRVVGTVELVLVELVVVELVVAGIVVASVVRGSVVWGSVVAGKAEVGMTVARTAVVAETTVLEVVAMALVEVAAAMLVEDVGGTVAAGVAIGAVGVSTGGSNRTTLSTTVLVVVVDVVVEVDVEVVVEVVGSGDTIGAAALMVMVPRTERIRLPLITSVMAIGARCIGPSDRRNSALPVAFAARTPLQSFPTVRIASDFRWRPSTVTTNGWSLVAVAGMVACSRGSAVVAASRLRTDNPIGTTSDARTDRAINVRRRRFTSEC
jgi:hypothetical protein